MVAGEGGMRDYVKKMHKIGENGNISLSCALKGKKSGGTDIASIVKC